MSNLFNVDVTAPVAETNPQALNEFRPSAKKGQAGVYQAYIRFLPNPKNPANGSIAQKYAAYITNYADNTSRWVDCPSSQGLPDPIQDTYFSLKKSANPNQVKAADAFSRKARYASLIQVIDCKSEPSLNGRVLVWPYGKKIYDKIVAEMNPGNAMVSAKNPFNMIQGRPFWVKVKEVTGFNNFDDSGFFDPNVPINVSVPYNGTLVPVTAESIQNPEFAQIVNTWLTTEAPSLDPYMYHEWDDDTKTFVMNAINAAKNPNVIVNGQGTMANNGFGAQVQNGFNNAPTGMPQQTPVMGGMPGMPGLGSMPGLGQMPSAQPMGQPMGQPMSQPQAAPAPAQQPMATAPGGFAASNIPNAADILNAGTPSPAAQTAPQTAPDVNNVLADILG